MELGKRIIKIAKDNQVLTDFLLFASVTIAFHFIYWNANMEDWMFGPFTKSVFDFFTEIAYKGTVVLSKIFISASAEYIDNSLIYYKINEFGVKIPFSTMNVIDSCSGIKQLLQLLLIMLVAPNKLWKRMIYFLSASIVVLFFNIVRVFGLTAVAIYHPDNYQFIHDWIGRPFHYVIIFLIWVIWMEKFARPKPQKVDAPQD